ncbi:hypothetical protein N7539_005355 [Penicillium diatomitis]|uniref:Involucrin repeat protein n=1 Tax=Penicillium diatomitis TaxID=2819901 RepID=A0A9W9X6U3_9EURO|nr:uncharacterized protein N7539_005355 [Penicillium diatomitis]KAJ5485367.1 hypothetical protein N7539_005355 [Penicillium diatomitis]
MFKALLGGSRSASSSDVRSTTSSGSKLVRRKTDSKSTSSRKSSRGDDRDRGLGDLSAYPGASTGSRRGPVSVAGESVASSYITAEPDPIDDYDRTTHEGNRRHRDGDRDSKTGRRRDRDRSGSRDRDRKRSSRRNVDDLYEEELIRERQRRYPERDYRERSRTYSGDHYAPHTSTAMPSSAPGAQFPVDTAAQHFPSYASPAHHPVTTSADHPLDGNAVSPSYDPHVQQQFPGQFPSGTAQPYYPPSNPAGAAADYYGDQGQSVNDQPGVRPQQPSVIPNSQTHLMTASASANPPPEPSSLGQVGAAAAYFTDDTPHGASQPIPPAASSSKPPKPDKPSIPSKLTRPQSSSAIPTAAALAAAGAVGYGIGEHEESQAAAAYQNDTHSSASFYQSHHNTQQGQSSSSRPPKPQSHSNSYSHSHGIGNGVGMAAAGAAAGYLIGHHHDSSSPTHSSHLPHYHQEHAALHGSNHGHPMAPSGAGAAGAGAYSSCEVQSPGFYPASSLAMQHRHKDPLTKFVDFWRDPEGVGRFEDYTETIGVCKYCFEPGTSSVNAPRKHNYRPRRHSADHYSSSGSSRVNKLSRYQSSDDERNSRKNSSKKSSSWLPGMLAGYAAKSIFTGKEFDDSYSVRSSEKSKYRDSQYYREEDRRSSTSRGVVRRSGRSSSGERHYDSNYRRRRNSPSRSRSRSHSQSRSSSRSGRHSIVKEAALGAAVGGTAMALATHHRDRSRSPARTRRRKDSSSSTSILDVSRSSPKSSGGFTSFFTSTSENRKKEKQKRRSKKTKGFFSFNGSSSSSLDADLAFGTGFAKKPGKLQKQNKKSKKDKDLNATLLGLGATATALAASSHGRSGRNKSQILSARDTRKSRHSPAGSGDDDEWVDAESEEHSSSSISSALAFGASSTSSGSESNGSGGWRWGWRSKKDKKKKQDKEKKSSHTDAILAAGAGALGSAAIASVARRQDSRPPSEASLQQVYPIPTSDPTRFDVAHISPSVVSDGRTPLVRPGSIPLQQPQPYTPVSQAVYSTHGALPGSIPAYSPASVPPIFANDYMQYHGQTQSLRHVGHAHDDSRGYKSLALRNRPHRSDSSPVFPTQEFSMTAPKRRSTARDQASVTFDLTEEQAERERRLDRRNREPREHIRDEPVQLIDREAELDRKDREWAERRERRDRRGYDEEERRQRDHDKDLDSSAWAEAAAIGAIGGALIGSMNFSRRKEDDDYSETSSRRHDRRAERRAERRSDSSVLSRSEFSEPYYGSKRSDEEQEDRAIEDNHDVATSPVRSSNSKPVYEDYADFFAPDEIRPNKHHSRDTPEHEPVEPRVIEAVPSPEREKNNDEPRSDLPQFAREPYEGRDLPWSVPRLHFIDPTPPHSINGSTRESKSPVIPVSSIETIEEEVEPNQSESRDKYDREIEYEARSEPRHDTYDNDDFDPSAHPVQKRDRSSTGSRVSWGPHQTHEYEIPSSSEHDPQSPTEEAFRDLVTPEQLSGGIDNPHGKSGFGDDIEFAAIAAAGAQAAGFDPSVVINDPKYHTRTSPPGSEDEGVYSRGSKWPTTSSAERHHRDLEDDRGTREWSRSRDRQPSVEEVPEEEDRPEKVSTFVHLDDPSTEQPESHPSTSEATEKSQSKASRAESPDNDAFSMPGGFDDGELSRDLPKDDMRSVVSAPLERESAKQKPKKTPRTSIDFETLRYIPSHEQKIVLPLEITEEHKESRRSEDQDLSFSRDKANSAVNDAPLDDDNDFVSVNQEDLDQTPRRKHRQRSSRDRDFDDAASNLSSPGPIYTEDADKSERRRHRSKRESDNFSVDDDVRSAVTLPDTGDKSERRKHRHRSSRDRDDDAASVVSSPAAVSYDDDEKSERRRRRSKRESDTFSVDDDARSAITSLDDPEKSERRKHRHRSSKDRDLDDNASVSSSPARIDETREKRRSNDGKDEKEKDKSGSFLRSLFGSRVSAPEERERTRSNQSSRSSSLEKKPSRDAVSETGVDDERRRRKKRSSRHRSSSRGDQLKDDASDQEGSTKGDVNLEDYRLRRQEKEERRRQRYGDIVESGKRRDSDKV